MGQISSTRDQPDISRGLPRPLLKWAGGKRALLKHIRSRMHEFPGRYIEPFIGAGAVFFSLPAETPKIGNDFNKELMEMYEIVRDSPNELLAALRRHINEKNHFYEVRSWDRQSGFMDRSAVERAARLIFLNKTCFNGLYRVNSRNEFNVPFGSIKNPDFVAESNISAVSEYLNHRSRGRLSSTLLRGDYQVATRQAREGDFVYLDPPYDPLSTTASFVSYQQGGFSREDQERLRDEILRLTELGVNVLASNSDTDFVSRLFEDRNIFRVSRVRTHRSISANTASRGSTSELLVDNYKATGWGEEKSA
jgi:DNA adenine methylase